LKNLINLKNLIQKYQKQINNNQVFKFINFFFDIFDIFENKLIKFFKKHPFF